MWHLMLVCWKLFFSIILFVAMNLTTVGFSKARNKGVKCGRLRNQGWDLLAQQDSRAEGLQRAGTTSLVAVSSPIQFSSLNSTINKQQWNFLIDWYELSLHWWNRITKIKYEFISVSVYLWFYVIWRVIYKGQKNNIREI